MSLPDDQSDKTQIDKGDIRPKCRFLTVETCIPLSTEGTAFGEDF